MQDEQELMDALGAVAGLAVYEWATQISSTFHVDDVMTTGKSAARVVAVTEQPHRDFRRKLIVKVFPSEGLDNNEREGYRHILAYDYASGFAKRHLVEMAHSPMRVGNGEWVVFQNLAGHSIEDMPSLGRLLDGVISGRHGICDAEQLQVVVQAMVQSLMRWRRDPQQPSEVVETAAFLKRLLDGRQLPGGNLHDRVTAAAPQLLAPGTRWMLLDGELLPNPLSLLSGNTGKLLPFEGPVHGDLHEENVLVDSAALRARAGRPGYRLIDLSRFHPVGLQAFEPVHLLLSMLGRHLEELSPTQQHALARYVVDPSDTANRDRFPGWAEKLVSATVRSAPECYRGLKAEWREQTLLSLIAGGLIYFGRRTTQNGHRGWFLRIAAYAADEHLALKGDERGPRPSAGELLPVDLDADVDHGPGPDPVDMPTAVLDVAPACEDRDGPPTSVEPDRHEDTSAGPASWDHVVDVPQLVAGVERAEVHPGGSFDAHQPKRLGDRDRQLADVLAEKVGKHWEGVANGRKLVTPGPIRIEWDMNPHGVAGPLADALDIDDPSHLTGAEGEATASLRTRGEVEDLLEVYRRLRFGRMVIDGAEGAGKTGAGIQLVTAILRHRQGLPDDERWLVPVPVILTPHDWDPEHQDLQQWITKRLVADYPRILGRRRAVAQVRQLVEDGHVALVLDGLDDMPAHLRSTALKVLDDQPRLRIVLISRTTEMIAAVSTAHLTSAVAVKLRAVRAAEAAAYLERCQVVPAPAGWARLVQELRDRPDGVVAQALDSPLMLGLVRDNYRGRPDDVAELLDRSRFPTTADVENHLLDGVLDTAYHRRPGEPGDKPPHYTREQAARWLGFLAQHLERSNTRDLAWWRLPEAVPWVQRLVAYTLATSVGPAALFGAIGFLTGHPERGLILGGVFGPGALLYEAVVVHGKEREHRATARRIGVGYLLASALAGIVTGTLLVGVRQGAPLGLATGVGTGLVAFPLVVRTARWLRADSRPTAAADDSPLRPDAYWRQDRTHSMVFGSMLALVVGVTLALVCAVVGEPIRRVGGAVALEAVMMWFYALMLSRRAKTKIASILLWTRRRGPVRLIPFLEEARRLDVLRSAGPVYQFRHARLQDLLARDDRDARDARKADDADVTPPEVDEVGRARAGGSGRWRGRRRPVR